MLHDLEKPRLVEVGDRKPVNVLRSKAIHHHKPTTMKKQFQHSPAPHTVEQGEGSDSYVFRDTNGDAIGELCSISAKTYDNMKANATLYAAAPDLLEACRALLKELIFLHGDECVSPPCITKKAIIEARAAIRKATGAQTDEEARGSRRTSEYPYTKILELAQYAESLIGNLFADSPILVDLQKQLTVAIAQATDKNDEPHKRTPEDRPAGQTPEGVTKLQELVSLRHMAKQYENYLENKGLAEDFQDWYDDREADLSTHHDPE